MYPFSDRLHLTLWVFIIYLIFVKVIAIHELSFLGDEFDDYKIIHSDLENIDNFFEESYEHDQARLPHLLAIPFILVFNNESLFMVRLFYIIIHVAYLFLFFQMLKLKMPNIQALYCTVLVGSSSYLASFSIFSMTTSNNLYLLTLVMAFYYYLRYIECYPGFLRIRSYVTFPIILGLCVASKLWGVFVIASIFVYDLLIKLKRKESYPDKSNKIIAMLIGGTNIFFTLLILFQNYLHVLAKYRLALSLSLSTLYLTVMIVIWIKGQTTVFIPFSVRWILIVHGALNFTLVFSPNYMNLVNIREIFNWYKIWNVPDYLVNPNPLDIFYIFLIKFGILNIVALLLSFIILYNSQTLKLFILCNSLPLLFSCITLVFLLIPRFVVTWYPIPIFQFLYLPISYMITQLHWLSNRFMCFGLIILCIVLPIHEQYRYLKLFPYGHLDGYQWGKKFIGWSKPSFVTFEAIPLLYKFLISNTGQEHKTIIVNVVQSKSYNRWATQVLREYFLSKEIHNYKFIDYYLTNKDSSIFLINNQGSLVLTSNYTPENFVTNLEFIGKELYSCKLFELVLCTLWEFNPK